VFFLKGGVLLRKPFKYEDCQHQFFGYLVLMSASISTPDIRDYISRHLADVFDTMLSMKVATSPDGEIPVFKERVSGSVGFIGETVTGSVYLHLPGAFASQATGAMLGMPPEEQASDSDIKDVVGEMTNMVAGGFKSWLCDAGLLCALTTPAVIRGSSFAITASQGVERIPLRFDCGESSGIVEITIKFV
jgi:CheY-specific phosphatase CheX